MPEKCCAFLAAIGHIALIQDQMDENDKRMVTISEGDILEMADFCDEVSVLFESYAEGLRSLNAICGI